MKAFLDKAVAVNQRNPEIVRLATPSPKSEPTITFSGTDQVQFSTTLVEMCGLRLDLYVHFYYLGQLWYFIVNDDPTGFPLRKTSKANVRINSKPLIRMFREKAERPENCSFFVTPTKMQYHNCPVFQILTDKSRKELQDQKPDAA